jgi:DNA repair protein SbcC/Rad50
MEVKLKSLSLHYFKGIKKLDIEFNPDKTDIRGANATGKTTIVDAFTWLFFGKDSNNRADTNFNIKTLENGLPLEKVEHEVVGILDVDGSETRFTRTLKEKWQTKRGEEKETFAGNETSYAIDYVPKKKSEYDQYVSTVLDESLFRQITNPFYFANLSWTERRDTLFKIAGNVTNKDIAAGNPDFEKLLTDIGNKSLDDYKKMLQDKIRKSKDEMKSIPVRIDEINRNMPHPIEEITVNREIEKLENELSNIDKQLSSYAEAKRHQNDAAQKIWNTVQTLQSEARRIEEKERMKLDDLQNERKRKVNEWKRDIEILNIQIKEYEDQCFTIDKENVELNQSLIELREQFTEESKNVFTLDENETICPTCKRELDPLDIETKREELEGNFNKRKQETLHSINLKGKALKEKIENNNQKVEKNNKEILEYEDSIKSLEEKIKEFEENLNPLPTVEYVLQKNTQYQELLKTIEETKKKAEESENKDEEKVPDYFSQKSQINSRIKELNEQLTLAREAEKDKERIKDLEKENRNLSQSVASYEKQLHTLQMFEKTKVEKIESNINSMFKYVTFKMFKQNINGSEEPTCIILINGVPFEDANNAARINAGIDIINTLTNYYKVSAPIFIDNAEAVNNIIETNSQLIKLVVTTDSELIIN